MASIQGHTFQSEVGTNYDIDTTYETQFNDLKGAEVQLQETLENVDPDSTLDLMMAQKAVQDFGTRTTLMTGTLSARAKANDAVAGNIR